MAYIYQNSLVRLCIEVKWKRDLIYKIIYNKIYNFIIKTNQGNKGLISADRRTKPTLVRTIPRYIVKSSTRDLSYPIFSIVISYDVAPKRILIQVTSGMVNINAFQHGF